MIDIDDLKEPTNMELVNKNGGEPQLLQEHPYPFLIDPLVIDPLIFDHEEPDPDAIEPHSSLESDAPPKDANSSQEQQLDGQDLVPVPTPIQAVTAALEPTPTMEVIPPPQPNYVQFSRYDRDRSEPVSALDLAEKVRHWVSLKRVGGTLYRFTGNHYRRMSDDDAKALVLNLLHQELRHSSLNFQLSNILTALKADPSIEGTPDRIPNRLALQNGELDLESLALLTPNFSHFHTHFLDVPWHGRQPCPVFVEFLRFTAGGDPDLIQRILESIGYLFTPGYQAKRFVLFQGVGDSGKSVLGSLIRSFFEPDAVAALSANQFGDRFGMSFLVGRRLNVSMDLPDGLLDSRAIGTIKQLTGGDMVSVEPKGKEAYAAKLDCKLLFGTNHPLVLKVHDAAFAKRVLLIPFRYPVPEGQMDRELGRKLEQERPGILYLAISAYREVVRRGYVFTGEERFGFKLRDIVVPESPQVGVEAFIQACCEVGDLESFATSETIYAAYLRYCSQTARTALGSSAAFSRALYALLLGRIQPIKRRVGGTPLNGYVGIKLKEE